MTPYQRLLLPENLYYAWQKAKRLYRMDDGHTNQGELLEFELDLENRLEHIHQQFLRGKYKLQPIKPVPRPKKLENGKYINRQYHHIAVDDQVAWIAVVNALGPALDQQMFAWSYGNRLYRPAWYEEENPESKLEIGPYRHASGYLYKKFQHGWPLYRRHIALTARKMVGSINRKNESEPDRRAHEYALREGLSYLKEKDYFECNRKNNINKDLYYASIDLKQFYPNIRSENIISELCKEQDIEEEFRSLLKMMLKFSLDKSDIPPQFLEDVEPLFPIKNIKGLPTGLFAAGFLSNVAMLPVDKIVEEELQKKRSFAHFRYVDDHTILTYDFDELCKWIERYKKIVKEKVGVKVNEDKTDPESLLDWINISKKESTTARMTNKKYKARKKAKEDSKIDGMNPTKLLSKTLEKMSIIAGQDTNVLDEQNLIDRLKDLEWLLLADIPVREIRPDTRASFSASRITSLAPILIQETDYSLDLYRDRSRDLARLDGKIKLLRENSECNNEEINSIEIEKQRIRDLMYDQENELIDDEDKQFSYYFQLLIHAIKENPEKTPVFFRLHQYCLRTGHQGLKQIMAWTESLRKQHAGVWSDYYVGLTLQILAQNILKALRVMITPSNLRSDQYAAKSHLEDITTIDQCIFKKDSDSTTWFYKIARYEYGVSASIALEYLKLHGEDDLASRYENIVEFHQAPKLNDDSSTWLDKTGYASGNWAYFAEMSLSLDSVPTDLWKMFGDKFDYNNISDQNAARLYPELLPEIFWDKLLQLPSMKNEDNSGWVYELIKHKDGWERYADKIRTKAFKRATRVLDAENSRDKYISIADWTNFINSKECRPLDPRRSEWTALEIIRKIVETQVIFQNDTPLNRLHPQNILIPKQWTKLDGKNLSWEKWADCIKNHPEIIISELKYSLLDYRYHGYKNYGSDIRLKQENEFASIGRLLLGLLRRNHSVPAIWNIRGNERIVAIPRAQIFRSLAISSPTLLLIESCIDPRSAESRLIASQPNLFGLLEGDCPNDTQYDPPPLNNVNRLIDAIHNAQKILTDNQLSVSKHQPRQLIPFRISDFATSNTDESEEI